MEGMDNALNELKSFQEKNGLSDNDIICVIGPVSFSVAGVRTQLKTNSKTGKFFRENLTKLLSDEIVPIIIRTKEKN